MEGSGVVAAHRVQFLEPCHPLGKSPNLSHQRVYLGLVPFVQFS